MTNTEAMITLLHLSDKDLERIELPYLKDCLGTLRCITRQLEREIIRREIAGEYRKLMLK